MAIVQLARDNIACLEQAASLIGDLVGQPELDFGVCLGPHLRHVLDHYDSFFEGLETGCVDYDARERDRDCEHHLAVAQQRIARTIARLEALSQAELPVRVWVRLATSADGTAHQSWSSPDRELQFLQSHAVHHFALMRLVAQQAGVQLAADFGKAPSTVRHERERATG